MTHVARVSDLIAEGALRVEDGNHGEYRPRPAEFAEDGVPFIRAADMTSGVVDFQSAGKIDKAARVRIRKGIGLPGDAILSHKGTVGKVAVAPSDSPDYVCSPQTTFWRSLDPTRLVQRYLPYVLKSPGFVTQLHYLMGQTDMAPYVSLTDQRSMLIPLPPIFTQQGIADVLGSLDDKIAANTKLTATASTLCDSLFVSVVGPWDECQALGATVSVTKGVSYRSGELDPASSQAMVTLKSFTRDGSYSYAGLKGYAGMPKTAQRVAPGEIAVAQTDLTQAAEVVGRAVRVPASDTYPRLVASLDVAIVRPLDDTPREFLLGVMRDPRFRQHCRDRTSGTTVLHLGRRAIEDFCGPLVGHAVQQKYAAVAGPLHDVSEQLNRESRTLSSTRDALLPLLMSGKIRVKDAEGVVEGVV